MTKPRAPLSIDAALARIAGQVPGEWRAMADHVGYAERTVRKWGDAEDEAEINLKAAIALDALFQQNGGEGRPIYEAYGLLVGACAAERFVDQFDLLRCAIDVAKETGDAEAALMRLALPDAGAADRLVAQRELMQALDSIRAALLKVTAAPAPSLPERHSRAPP